MKFVVYKFLSCQRLKFRKTTKPVLFLAGDKGRNTKDTGVCFFTIHVSNCFTLEPQKECIVYFFIDNNSTTFDGKCLLFSPSFSKGKEKDLIAATGLVKPKSL